MEYRKGRIWETRIPICTLVFSVSMTRRQSYVYPVSHFTGKR